MNHFNFKSLTFYGVAISSVLLLFKVVTAYGESNLKAPTPINGRYRLVLAENLPNCQKSADSRMLIIQQSGIYVNGSLLPANTTAELSTTTKEKPSLTGILKNEQLSLSGKVPRAVICNLPVSQTQGNAFNSVKIQMRLVDGSDPVGQLTGNGIPQAIEFTAVSQKESEQSNNSSSH